MMPYWLGYIFAFLLGMVLMGVLIILHLWRLHKKLEFDIKLQLIASGYDAQEVDEILKGLEKWWTNE